MPLTPELYRRLLTAKLYIEDSLEEQLNLESISRLACLSPYHFHRLFTRVYRRTPHQYLTRVRLARASKLLEETPLPVSDISTAVGFESPSSFSLLFKRNTGMAPVAFRNKALLKKKAVAETPLRFIPHCFNEQLLHLTSKAISDK